MKHGSFTRVLDVYFRATNCCDFDHVGPRLSKFALRFDAGPLVLDELPATRQFPWHFSSSCHSVTWWLERRRSQTAKKKWEQLTPVLERWIPSPQVLHPYPEARFYATHPS